MKVDTKMNTTINKTVHLILILVLTLFSFSQLKAQVTQEWVQRYSGPVTGSMGNLTSMAIDTSGNVYVTGARGANGKSAYVTIKYNSIGTEQWVATYGDSSMARSIAVDGSGNVYVTGGSWESGNLDCATIKYNPSGGEEWVQRYNGPGNLRDAGNAIAVDGSGNVYVTGFRDGGGGAYDYVTIKYNSSGVEQWVQAYNGTGNSYDEAFAIALDNSGNVYVTGASNGTSWSDYATIKYDSLGVQQWVKRYDGPGSGLDIPHSIAVDNSGNVYVTGQSEGTTGSDDYATIKYSTWGAQMWVQRYNGPGNSADGARSIAVDQYGYVYVTGFSVGNGTGDDYATIKYDNNGIQQWVQRYNGPANGSDRAYSLAVGALGDVYVTGSSMNGTGLASDYATIKYNSSGGQMWVVRYHGPATNGEDYAFSIAVHDSDVVYVAGSSAQTGIDDYAYATIKYSHQGSVYQPSASEKWISGETNTIKWSDYGWPSVNIKCILNLGTTQETKYIIAEGSSVSAPEYTWEIPDSLFSFLTKIIVENASDTTQYLESGVFRLKPYVLTTLIQENGGATYSPYKKSIDQWGFKNIESDVWTSTWWTKFNYQGIDPFTHHQYLQVGGDSLFIKAKSSDFPDWISWVNTFGIDACYYDTTHGRYKLTALLKWRAHSKKWGGSCFGIAASNALAFGYKYDFGAKYQYFPSFEHPFSVPSDTNVIKVVTELFTNQYGNPTIANDDIKDGITPTGTLNEIKQMLREDNAEVKTLSFFDNNGSGGHTILAYGLSQDTIQRNFYYVKVYDNSNPNSDKVIIIDTADYGGIGSWASGDWLFWGGNKNIYLEVPAFNYLNGGFFPIASAHTLPLITRKKRSKISNTAKSSFILSANTLEIDNSNEASISITDIDGNVTGFINDTVHNEIPGSFPRIIKNGSKTPPYGYNLPMDQYSVVMNNFTSDTVETYFFTGFESFAYERNGALQSQTDRLSYDYGLSVSNPDSQKKSVKLLNLVNFDTQENLFIARSLGLAQNDSIRIENEILPSPESNTIKLISYGSAKNYNVELNSSSTTGFGRFVSDNIPLPENTSHTYVPDWTDVANTDLTVLVDVGNDGTIDDTLHLQNILTDARDHGSLIPSDYKLYQCYPNPFNPLTTIKYDVPKASHVTLKVFNMLGQEVATLVDGNRNAGTYEVQFDGSKLTSGVYFYRLQSDNFTETKKLLLMK